MAGLKLFRPAWALATLGLLGLSAVARADVTLPAILGDHMVLQRDMSVPIWGWADKGEDVTVTFGEQKLTTKADDQGKWRVNLAPLKASETPGDLTVSGKNTLTLHDVLVGEVWLCSGQSNMEFSMSSVKNHDQEIADANHPNIRLFTVPKKIANEPVDKIKADWQPCDPKSVKYFTAVGYFFGLTLHKELHVPVGLIHSSWGGTPAESWVSRPMLEGDADFAQILHRAQPDVLEAEYKKSLATYEAATQAAKQDPTKKAPYKPSDPAHNPNVASVLYNGMINPIVPFAMRGATWYQGESNAGRAVQYRKLLATMVKNWRDAWNQPGEAHDFEFLIVQLANFQQPAKEPGDNAWAELREAQAIVGAQPHNGIATAIDLADAENPGDIHPKDKQDVGKRLALVALANVYGKSDVEYSGPLFDGDKIDGPTVHIRYTHAQGLEAKGGEPIKGFQIAGADHKWHWADAKLNGAGVDVSSPDVPQPQAVRYDWSQNPQGNLYNAAGLPAMPFRTDDWPEITANNK